MENFLELERKYKADDIKLTDFHKLVKSSNPVAYKEASSFDHYFVNKDEFIRFRESQDPELTKKIKNSEINAQNRTEVDLPLDNKRLTKEIVEKWAELEGYKHNFTIYKNCFIYWFDLVNIVYYISYNEELKELDRFLEIEVNKSKVNELGLEGATKILNEYEQKLSKLGILPQNRMRKSLFDLYRK